MVTALRDITQAASEHFQVRSASIMGPRRFPRLVKARQVSMFLGRAVARQTYPRIGKFFDRDHTTVLHACRAVTERLEADEYLADLIAVASLATAIARGRGEIARDRAQDLHCENARLLPMPVAPAIRAPWTPPQCFARNVLVLPRRHVTVERIAKSFDPSTDGRKMPLRLEGVAHGT